MNMALLTRMSKREKTVFTVTVLCVSVALVDRAMIAPIASRIRLLDEKIAAQTELVKKNVRIVAEKDRVKATAKEFSVYSRKAATQEEEVAFLLGEVETLARKNSLYIVDMKPLGMQEDKGSRKYSVDLNCEAQMDQLVSFMHDVENSQKLFVVESFNITSKSKDSSIAKCNLRISNIIFL